MDSGQSRGLRPVTNDPFIFVFRIPNSNFRFRKAFAPEPLNLQNVLTVYGAFDIFNVTI